MKAPKMYKSGGTTDDSKTLKPKAKAKDVEQKIASRYDLSKAPPIKERQAWNDYLNWIEKSKGYSGDKALELNKGAVDPFASLSTEYNDPNIIGSKYDELVKANPGKIKVSRDEYIKSRQVTPEMLKNAQAFYKKQTQQDARFGSETAQTYYPEINPHAFPKNPKDPNSFLNKNELAPVEIIDYKDATKTPFKAVAPVSYDPTTGKPTIDYSKSRDYVPADSANVYIDPNFAKNPRFKAYTNPSGVVAPVTTPTVLPLTPGLNKGGKVTKAPKKYASGTLPSGLPNIEDQNAKQEELLGKTAAGATDVAGKASNGNYTGAAIAGGSFLTDAAGNIIDAKSIDQETGLYKSQGAAIGSGALKGAGKGASMGAGIGTLFGPAGTAIGAGIGAGLGAGVGATVSGIRQKKGMNALEEAKALAAEEEKKRIIDERFAIGLNRQLTQRQEGYAGGGTVGTAKNVDGDFLTDDELNASMGYVPDAGNVEKQKIGLPEFGGDTSRIGLTASFKKGGYVHGPGTGTSDSVKAKIEAGSFITPAKNAKVAEKVLELVKGGKITKAPNMKKKADLDQEDGEEVKLSKGEFVFTPEQREEIISELGEDVLEALAPDAEHGEDEMKKGGLTAAKAKIILHDGTIRGKAITDKQRKYFGAISNGYVCGGKVDKMADGGVVKKKGQKLVDNGEEVTFDGKYWVNKDGGKKIRADYYDSYLKKEAEKAAKEDVKYKAYMADAIKRQSKLPETKMVSKTGAEIEAATGNKGKVSTAPKIGKKTSAAKETADKLTAKSPVEKLTMTDTEVVTPKSLMTTETVTEDGAGNKKPSNDALIKAGLGLGKQIGGLANYVIPYKQTQLGRKLLAESGKRPVDKIDPDFQNAVNKAQANAKFGYTPEEQALLDQRNVSALRSGENAARNYSGGSAGNALSMQRQAANDYFSRGLQSAISSKNLQMDKQAAANALVQDKAAMNRQLFGDTMNAFQQNQTAGGNLVGAGIANAIAATRLNREMAFQNKFAQNNNPYSQDYFNGLGS